MQQALELIEALLRRGVAGAGHHGQTGHHLDVVGLAPMLGHAFVHLGAHLARPLDQQRGEHDVGVFGRKGLPGLGLAGLDQQRVPLGHARDIQRASH